jgi:hypothetical protein
METGVLSSLDDNLSVVDSSFKDHMGVIGLRFLRSINNF